MHNISIMHGVHGSSKKYKIKKNCQQNSTYGRQIKRRQREDIFIMY